MPISILLRRRSAAVVLVLAAAGACGEDTPTVSPPPGSGGFLHLTVVAGDGQTGTVGEALGEDLVVQATDVAGHPLGSIAIVFLPSPGSGSIQSTSAFSATDTAGIARAQWILGPRAGGNQAVQAAPLTPSPGSDPTATFHAVARAAAPAAVRAVSRILDTIPLVNTYTASFSVEVKDRFENPVPQVPVGWTVGAGAGAFAAPTTLTGVDGMASSQWTIVGANGGGAPIAAGVYQLWASVTSLAVVPFVRAAGDVVVRSVAIATGSEHSCGLDGAGKAWCWGYNGEGELGNGTNTDQHLAVAVAGGRTYTALSAGGYHSCALAGDGTAWCWGRSLYGELGAASTGDQPAPVQVAGGLRFAALVAGYSHSCGITGEGTAYCWGAAWSGQLGYGGFGNHPTPVAVAAGVRVTAIALGSSHSCALDDQRELFCWGSNAAGQLGVTVAGSSYPASCGSPCSAVPLQVPGEYTGIVADGDHTCALGPTGRAVCWGDGATDHLAVDPTLGFASLTAGEGQICGLRADGRALCWTFVHVNEWYCYYYATCGPPHLSSAVTAFGSDPFLGLTGGSQHWCGIGRADERVKCWGLNTHGQLGDGTTLSRDTSAWVLFATSP